MILTKQKFNESKLSEHGYMTKPLFNLHIKGGLLHTDRIQKVEGAYYYPQGDMNGKIVIHFGIADVWHDKFVEKPSSLRFESINSLKSFIRHLLDVYVKVGREEGKITPANFLYMMKCDLEMVEDVYRQEIE